MGLVAIHPQEFFFVFACLTYILNICIMLLLIVKVILNSDDFFSKVVL